MDTNSFGAINITFFLTLPKSVFSFLSVSFTSFPSSLLHFLNTKWYTYPLDRWMISVWIFLIFSLSLKIFPSQSLTPGEMLCLESLEGLAFYLLLSSLGTAQFTECGKVPVSGTATAGKGGGALHTLSMTLFAALILTGIITWAWTMHPRVLWDWNPASL